MQASMSIPTAKVLLFQTLVKQHNLRFVGNFIQTGDTYYVTIDSDHLGPGTSNAFFEDWHRFNTAVVEKKSTLFQKIKCRVSGQFKAWKKMFFKPYGGNTNV